MVGQFSIGNQRESVKLVKKLCIYLVKMGGHKIIFIFIGILIWEEPRMDTLHSVIAIRTWRVSDSGNR